MAKNLRILGTSVGPFSRDDVVPAYALAAADPDSLVANRMADWTDDPATVDVSAESLAASAPDASADLVRAHAKAIADNRQLSSSVESLHGKCLSLEAKCQALEAELASKVNELAAVKSQRDKVAVELEEMKLLADSATAPSNPAQ